MLLTSELGGPPRPLFLLELARTLGGLVFVEQSAHRALGAVSATSGLSPALSVWAASSSLGHGWRASELEDLLPVSATLPERRELLSSPGPLVDSWLESLPGYLDTGSEQGLFDTKAWYRQLAAAYEHRLSHLHPSADGPVARVLRRLVFDLGEAFFEDLDRAWQSA